MKPTSDDIAQLLTACSLSNTEFHLWSDEHGALGCALRINDRSTVDTKTLRERFRKIGIENLIVELPDAPPKGGAFH